MSCRRLSFCLAASVAFGFLATPAQGQLILSGAISADPSQPLASARVELFAKLSTADESRDRRAVLEPTALAVSDTDLEGRFRLTAPTVGAFEVFVRADGRAPMVFGPLVLTQSRELPPLTMLPATTRSFRVLGGGERPASVGAWVRVRGPAEPTAPGARLQWRVAPRRARTGGDGSVLLPVLAGETAELEVLLPGEAVFRSAALADGVATVVRGAEPVAASPPALVTVTGRILDAATGRGLREALVAPALDLGALRRSDETGRFSFSVPAGASTTFEAHAPGYLPQRVAAKPEEIRSGRLPALALEPAARLEGTVVTAEGRPLLGVTLEAVAEGRLSARTFSPSDPVADRAASGEGGRFELSTLRAGKAYELRAKKQGYLPAAVMAVSPRARATQQALVRLTLERGRAATGKVLDLEGRAIVGARVVLRASLRPGRRAPDSYAEAVLLEEDPGNIRTTAGGEFFVAQCPAPEFDLELHSGGYAPSRRVGLRVRPGTGPVDLGTFVLRPGVQLQGRAIDRQGRPVPGAKIFLFDRLPSALALDEELGSRKARTTSGAKGEFTLVDLPAGVPHHLVVSAEGFLPASVRGVRPPTGKAVVVRLEKGFDLVGRVVDEQEQPLARAAIDLVTLPTLAGDPQRRQVGQGVIRQAVSATDGTFVVRGIPDGQAVLDVSAEGFVGLQQVEVDVPRPPSPTLVLRLRRGAVLSGRITTTRGEGVSGTRVLAANAAGLSDAEGSYRVTGVAEGEARVAVQHPSYRGVSRTAHIEAGENRLDIALEAGVVVEGRVLESDGESTANAEVRLGSVGRRDFREYGARSDSEGRFRLEPVATGAYHLQATALNGASAELPSPVVVGEENVDGLELILVSGARLSGNIVGLDPDELAGLAVEARDMEGRARRGHLLADGTYEITALAPGPWLVRAVLWQGQKEARVRIAVEAKDRELSRDLEFGGRLTLSGRVLFADEPLPNATLSVRGQRFAIERSVVTDFDGGFRLADLEADSYFLGVTQPEQFLVYNQTLELAESREVEIRLAAASVSGLVRSASDGAVISGAWVRLQPQEGPEFLILDSSQEDGSFHLPRVPPGRYRLAVSADGFVGAEQDLGVAAGEEATGLEIGLQPTSGTELQVQLATGGVPTLVNLLALDAGGKTALAETRATDKAGMVSIPSLPVGTWQLLVSATGASTTSAFATVPGEPVLVTLQPGAELQVMVPALMTSDRLATATVHGADGRLLWSLGPGGKVETIYPVVAGQSTITGVPPGSWLLQVQSSDGQTWNSVVAVSPGARTAVTLE